MSKFQDFRFGTDEMAVIQRGQWQGLMAENGMWSCWERMTEIPPPHLLGGQLTAFGDGCNSNSISKAFTLRRLLVDRGRITNQCVHGLSVFCEMSLSTAAVSGLSSACSMHVVHPNRESSVADSSTCPRYDEVVTRRGTQCRSCGYVGDWCQQVEIVSLLWRVSKKLLVNQQTQFVSNALCDWCNQWNSWRAGVTRSRCLRFRTVRAAACRAR